MDNDYFVDVKNEVTDGGQELTGFYNKGQLKKILYSVGLSYGMTTYEYYFSDNELLFVLERQDTYSQVKDSMGLEFVFEGRYYFDKSKLIETKEIGREWFVDERKGNKENEFLADSKSFLEELVNAKKLNNND